jgi:hypothetical protein
MKTNPRLNEALGKVVGSESRPMNKVERMAHARAHRGGQVPDHKLTGPEALAKQIEDSKAQREKEMRERAAAASEREVRAKEAKKKQTREQQLEDGFIKAIPRRGHVREWKKFTVAEWEAMSVEQRCGYNVARTAEINNYYQLSARVRRGGGRGALVHASLSPPRRF